MILETQDVQVQLVQCLTQHTQECAWLQRADTGCTGEHRPYASRCTRAAAALCVTGGTSLISMLCM